MADMGQAWMEDVPEPEGRELAAWVFWNSVPVWSRLHEVTGKCGRLPRASRVQARKASAYTGVPMELAGRMILKMGMTR